ncbi:hypothetical protein [Chryseobacterium sp. C3]|nr:hypothetical protein [Chryseobacterium sp. C3]
MNSIYNEFAFVKALSINDLKTIKKDNFFDDKKEEKPFSHAVVEFRTVYKTYDGSFGFDWYRKKDNGLSYGGMYKSFIKSGYKDGITNLEPDEAINRFLDMYEEYPINLPSRKSQKEREEKNYQVPYLSMFSKETVEKMKLSKDIVQPQFSIALCAIVEIARNSVLEFDYDTNLFEVTPKILADKSADRGIRQSKTSEITITCKKDLNANKEIKIYAYPQDKKYKRSLAGKITVLQNDEKARKTVNFALVNIKTKIRDKENIGIIEPEEINTLRKAMYQCLIVPHIVEMPLLDLTDNENFKIVQDSSGKNKYGKYILKNTNPIVEWTDGGIFHSIDYTDCQDYVKKLCISKNKDVLKNNFKTIKYNADEKEMADNIFTAFAFKEDSFRTYRSSSILKSQATEGEVKDIGENTVMLFNSLNSPKRADDTTLAHEVLHGLGIYHIHIDENPIPTPKILCTFEKKDTDNYMSYRAITSGAVTSTDIKNILWRWQWKIANPNIPSIEKDPK